MKTSTAIKSAPRYWSEEPANRPDRARIRARIGGLHCSLCTGTIEKSHIPSDFVVDQEASDVESGLYREILSLDNVLSPDSLSNNISNINGLRFYHEIRWNLDFITPDSRQGRLLGPYSHPSTLLQFFVIGVV